MDSVPVAKRVLQDQCYDLLLSGEEEPKKIQIGKLISQQE